MAMAVAALREHILRQRALGSEDDYSGGAMSEAERAAESDEQGAGGGAGYPHGPWRRNLERILDFDPKQRGKYCNRLNLLNLSKFDLDEECNPPIYSHRSHLDESLILSGPKRAIALKGDDYVEIDLKIKDHQGQHKELSKGFVTIRGIAGRSLDTCTVESESLATRLSTVDVTYAVQIRAVEATAAIEVLRGDFYGEITAYTTSIRNSLVLYDSKLVDEPSNGNGVIQLMRPILSVCFMDMRMLSIVSWTADGKYQPTEEFTPRLNREVDEITLGFTKMRIKVTWSVMD